VPFDDGFGLDDGQGRSPVRPEAGQHDPEEAVAGSKSWAFAGLPEDGDLLSQGEVLDGGGSAAYNECSEKEYVGFDDAHDSMFLHSANGKSYRKMLVWANGCSHSLSQDDHRIRRLGSSLV